MKIRAPLLLFALTIVSPFAAPAEDRACRPEDETLEACRNRIIAEAAPAIRSGAAKEVREALTSKPSATDTGASAVSAKDFLPVVVGALGLGQLEEGEGSQTLTYNLSPPAASVQTVVKAVRRDPEPLEALVQAIPEEIRADRKSALEDGLGDFDDLETSISVNLEIGKGTWRTGRGLGRYGDVSSLVYESARTAEAGEAWQKLLGYLESHRLKLDAELSDPAVTDTVERAVADAALESAGAARRFHEALEESGYFRLADLVANQPQLHFELAYRSREEAVGPDELRLKATYEHGFGNVNGLLRRCEKSFEAFREQLESDRSEATGPKLTAAARGANECYSGYAVDPKRTASPSNRVSFSLEYTQASDLELALPEDDFTFTLDETEKLIGALVYGRNLTRDEEGKETSRFDLEAKYEDVTGDPDRNSRFVATATYSLGIFDGNTLAFDLVYANKPEYLGEVDEELSARVGLRFKLDKKEE